MGAVMSVKLIFILLVGALCCPFVNAEEPHIASHKETLACEIVRKRGDWFAAARQSESRWGVPAANLLALLADDQNLSSGQLPARWRPSWSNGHNRPGIPDGFVESTWTQFQFQTGQPNASSSSIRSILDFMGWYVSSLARYHNLATEDAAGQFVLWRYGSDVYSSGSWRHSPWVKTQADQFSARALAYKADLETCADKPDKGQSDKLSTFSVPEPFTTQKLGGRPGYGKPGYVPNELISSR